ncbi:hypothetical protein V1478_017545, partial [Vespula squamosa]
MAATAATATAAAADVSALLSLDAFTSRCLDVLDRPADLWQLTGYWGQRTVTDTGIARTNWLARGEDRGYERISKETCPFRFDWIDAVIVLIVSLTLRINLRISRTREKSKLLRTRLLFRTSGFSIEFSKKTTVDYRITWFRITSRKNFFTGNKRGAKEIEKFDRKSKEDGPKDWMEHCPSYTRCTYEKETNKQ